MNSIGSSILIILVFVVLFAPRRLALLGMMAGALYLPQSQQLSILGFNFFAMRFIELAGFIRVISRREFSFARLNGIDRAILWLYSFVAIVFLLRSSDGQAFQIGVTMDTFFCYFTFRGLLADVVEFKWFLCAFVVLLTPFTALVLIESITRHNPFSILGGSIEYGWLREGRMRCQGSFRHPSLMGTLGAVFFPLYIGLAVTRAERWRACFGIVLCMIIVWASDSGGPLSAAAMGVVGWLFWRIRTQMRKVRWVIVGLIALAALLMKAPVWYLLARMSSISGGDGWHRSFLFEVSFNHFSQWWFAGIPLKDTSGWFPYDLGSTGGADVTNQFIAFGFTAGLMAPILFIVVLKRAFSSLGKALQDVRSNSERTSETELLLWGMGVMLVVHIVNWFGISYWDQTYVIWFMQLAAVSGLSEACVKPSEIPAPAAASEGEDFSQPKTFLGI
jgi:hypothetical protein